MALTVGARLGVYDITGALGAGGMGEVYRARDGTLQRDVALKILPEAFAFDADRLVRFRREAQVLASLNHPNIAAIYGFEESTSVHALVLELVEGPTLADRIAQGPIPLDEALPIARQIAEALEAAHEHGVIHRDLKPANIKLRSDGAVKVLDFGLAKSTGPPEGAQHVAGAGDRSVRLQPDLSASPTITSPAMMTGIGVILGTAAYMSPEQAKGRPADKRSDIWAFGCVLYEMLTGNSPFGGDDVSDTLANVLKREPDYSLVPDVVPPAIRTLTRRCLVKDRRQRIPDISVAQFVLTEPAGLTADSVADRTRERDTTRRRILPIVAATLLTAVIVAAGAWAFRPVALAPPPVARFSISLSQGQDYTSQTRQLLAISPDGTQLVYVVNNQLYRRPIGELQGQPVLGTDLPGVANPAFSPDGASIAFYAASDATLKRIPVSGGTPATITRASIPFGMTWSEAGIVFGGGPQGIWRVSPIGGTPERVVSVDAGQQAYGPQILPGGDTILFTLAGTTGDDRWDTARIVVQSLKSGTRTTVIENASDARYLPTGHLVYASSGTLLAVGFDARTHMTRGEPVQVLAGVRRAVPAVTGAAQFSVSDTGSLVYVLGPANATMNLRTILLADRTGAQVPLQLPPGNYSHPRVSPDGGRLAVAVEDGQTASVWIYELAGTSHIRRLTLEGRNRYPVWSGDGLRVAFQSDRQGHPGIFWQRADGGGAAEQLTMPPEGAGHIPESWSRDGKHLLFTEQKAGRYVLFSLALEDKTITPYGDVQSDSPTGAAFSPDGRWVTYAANPGGGILSPNRGVFVQPFPATGVRYPLPKTLIDFHPVWSADGTEIFYVGASAQPFVAVRLRTQPGVTFGPPTPLAQAVPKPGIPAGEARGYDVLPDGKFLAVVPAIAQDAAGAALGPEIRVVLNWHEELKRLVPEH